MYYSPQTLPWQPHIADEGLPHKALVPPTGANRQAVRETADGEAEAIARRRVPARASAPAGRRRWRWALSTALTRQEVEVVWETPEHGRDVDRIPVSDVRRANSQTNSKCGGTRRFP